MIIARFFSGLIASALRTKIVLDRKPPDLSMEFFDVSLGRPLGLAASGKHIGHTLNRLTLPRADLVRMNLMLGCNILDRLVVSQRFQCHPRLKLVFKLPAIRHLRIPSKV